jgi:hypothetical protein
MMEFASSRSNFLLLIMNIIDYVCTNLNQENENKLILSNTLGTFLVMYP